MDLFSSRLQLDCTLTLQENQLIEGGLGPVFLSDFSI